MSPNWSSQWGGGRLTSGARGSLTVGTDTCGQRLGYRDTRFPGDLGLLVNVEAPAGPAGRFHAGLGGYSQALPQLPVASQYRGVPLGDKNIRMPPSLRFSLVPPHSLSSPFTESSLMAGMTLKLLFPLPSVLAEVPPPVRSASFSPNLWRMAPPE